jgi:SAM-dependent methyltransferase
VSSATKLSGKYDVIVSIGTLEHMDDPFGVLKRFKKHLKPGGKIVVTSPNWTNPRGYILQTLFQLFDMKITLADLHYLTPIEFERWARKLGMKLYWRTFDRDWAHGNKLIADFNRRLPLVFKSSGKHLSSQQVKSFTSWLEDHVVALDHNTPSSGAIGIYVFQAR